MDIVIYTDGASRKNPGESASGYMIFDSSEKNLLAKDAIYNGVRTNNEAEYIAIISALKRAADDFGYRIAIRLYSDSELVVRQINGKYKVKEVSLGKLHSEVIKIMGLFDRCTFENVRRENIHIKEVDSLINLLLDSLGK
jgi:ribonuclease HI